MECMRITIAGAGHLGSRIAKCVDRPTWALTQSTLRHEALQSTWVTPTTQWPELTSEDDLILCLPGSVLQEQAVQRLREHARPRRAVLVSTTGFHAPYTGRIHSGSPPGTSSRAQQAAKTEAAFAQWMGDQGAIVRLGGLWHESRGPFAAFKRTGRARLGPPNQPMPLIHYDDAATLVWNALLEGPRVVLGVVCQPTRHAIYAKAAATFGHPLPDFTAPLLHPPTFVHEAATALLGTPQHPDWRAGIDKQ